MVNLGLEPVDRPRRSRLGRSAWLRRPTTSFAGFRQGVWQTPCPTILTERNRRRVKGILSADTWRSLAM